MPRMAEERPSQESKDIRKLRALLVETLKETEKVYRPTCVIAAIF